mmetsp:Transcript_139101/g.245776  ORF Transcript_139101/g.245776 Transcript_139101/m.245776 type:complete len:208 (+) Transcript_139101:149-772(+)
MTMATKPINSQPDCHIDVAPSMFSVASLRSSLQAKKRRAAMPKEVMPTSNIGASAVALAAPATPLAVRPKGSRAASTHFRNPVCITRAPNVIPRNPISTAVAAASITAPCPDVALINPISIPSITTSMYIGKVSPHGTFFNRSMPVDLEATMRFDAAGLLGLVCRLQLGVPMDAPASDRYGDRGAATFTLLGSVVMLFACTMMSLVA